MTSADHEIVVMTFNVLAQKLIKREFYPHCTKQDLKLKFRGPKVIQEILKYDPDIACLQEIDFLELFEPDLTSHGYEWEIKKKSPDGHGLAILYKKSLLLKKDYKAISYDEINSFNSSFVCLETGNSAQLLKLEIINTNRTIIVSNTHLYWRPEASAIKIKQAWVLIESLFDFMGDSDATVLLCGDWNIMPQDILYRLLTRKESVSEYELEHVFEKVFDHGIHDRAACEKVLAFYPKIPNLKSAYKEFYGEEPPYTTTSKDFTGVLDYIFVFGEGLVIQNVKQIRDIGEIPNAHFPSDHVPVIATFSSKSLTV